jgi:hypothetical protein
VSALQFLYAACMVLLVAMWIAVRRLATRARREGRPLLDVQQTRLRIIRIMTPIGLLVLTLAFVAEGRK